MSEGDLLRHLMYASGDPSIAGAERVRVVDVQLRVKVEAVDIDADIEKLFERAIEQNFVPVQDSRGAFVGIVQRRRILEYCAGLVRAKNGES